MVPIKDLGIILLILILVVFAILIILVLLEKRLRKKVIKNEGSRNISYMNRIDRVNEINPKNTLANLDKIAREFFKESFMIKTTADYSKLDNFFEQKNKTEIAEFCRLMNNALYSGKKSDKENVEKLILSLKSVIKNNPLFTKEELERMELEKKGFWNHLKNIRIPGVGEKESKNE